MDIAEQHELLVRILDFICQYVDLGHNSHSGSQSTRIVVYREFILKPPVTQQEFFKHYLIALAGFCTVLVGAKRSGNFAMKNSVTMVAFG